jgi:flagellar protein FlaG
MSISPLQGILQLPAVATQPPTTEQLAAHREIVTAVKAVNHSEMLGPNNELAFTMDRDTRQPVIQIVDRVTKEVVQQIPPEYVLRVAASLLR